MQQRQLRLGDILDDYCPRERRLTNHAVVAMVGDNVRQTRCTTCDTEHEYKHAKVPRQRRKGEEPAALYSQVLSGGPKRVAPERPAAPSEEAAVGDAIELPAHPPLSVPASTEPSAIVAQQVNDVGSEVVAAEAAAGADERSEAEGGKKDVEDGPVHRPLIRATLPRLEGQAPPARPAPDFTIRQPGGRTNRFRGRNQRGPQAFQGNRSNGPMSGGRGGSSRQNGGRPPQGASSSHPARRHDAGRKRSK
jgi:hypothetical protein